MTSFLCRATKTSLAAFLSVVFAGLAIDAQGVRSSGPPPIEVPRDPTATRTRGTLDLRGSVVSATDGTALRGVHVHITGTAQRHVFTDNRGQFSADGLTVGDYYISASKSGYITVHYGQQSGAPGERRRAVKLLDIQPVDGIRIALPRGGVIVGNVVDERGREMVHVPVEVFQWRWNAGRKFLSGVGLIDRTDDRGEFRVFGLQEGQYMVAALPQGGGTDGRQLTVYYPGVFAADAAGVISVRSGLESSGVTLVVPEASKGVVDGRVEKADGGVAANASITLSPHGYGATSASARVAPDGTFRIPSVPPGQYRLTASTGASENEFVSVPLIVTPGTTSVHLTLRRRWSMRGRFIFETGLPAAQLKPPPAIAGIEAWDDFAAKPSGALRTAVPGWTFELNGLQGSYIVRPMAPTGWYVKRLMLRETDITDKPIDVINEDVNGIEVHLTQKTTALLGVLFRQADGVIDEAVIVFAQDSRLWGPGTRYVVTSRPDQSGAYAFKGLPPGDYSVIAVKGLPLGEETNPDVLRSVQERAVRVSLQDGQTVELNLAANAKN